MTKPTDTFGAALWAFGPRTVMATIAFDTDGGWYTAEVPAQPLAEKDRHYRSDWTAFVRKEWTSSPFYVRFPKAVTVKDAWVMSAQSQGDAFGWSADGVTQCLPLGTAAWVRAPNVPGAEAVVDSKDVDRLDSPPNPQSLVLTASVSKPLGDISCGQPFRPATISRQEPPQYPDAARGVLGVRTASVLVAINAGGAVADAWIWSPSGIDVLDQESLRAAKASSYHNAVAYCQAVPGLYQFKVTFDPGRP